MFGINSDNIKIDDYFEHTYPEHPEQGCPFPIPKDADLGKILDLKDDYLENFKYLDGSKDYPNVVMSGLVSVGKDTIIEPFVLIEGPVVIGDNCQIRAGAVIRPKTLIGDNVVIGHGAEIVNALIMSKAKVQVNTIFEDSIAGFGARVGSGAITANRRFDQGEINLVIGNHTFKTGRDKFGCLLGDYARLGANVTTSPGIAIGKYSWIYPNALLRESIPKETLVKLRQHITTAHKGANELKDSDGHGKA